MPAGSASPGAYLLALVVAAVAAGQTSVLAMVDLGPASMPPNCWRPCNRPVLRIPSAATWRRVLEHIDLAALEQQVAVHNQALDQADASAGRVLMADGQLWRGQAVDGKDVRGASAHGQHTFLVSLGAPRQRLRPGASRGRRKTNEITVVPTLLAGRDLTGTVTTMDALLTQRSLAQQILAQDGHYLMIVKKNQPTLYWAADLLFREPPVPARPGELLTSQTAGQGPRPPGTPQRWPAPRPSTSYLRWPGVAQVLRRTCRRINLRTGRVETEVTYGLTSLPRAAGWPSHNWSTSGAATGRSRTASTMSAMKRSAKTAASSRPATPRKRLAAFRNAVLSLLRFHGWSNIAAATRSYAGQPQRALRLLGVPAL